MGKTNGKTSFVPPKNTTPYTLGEEFTNPYLGCKFTEILMLDKKRAGWVWTHRDGRIVIAPHLGTYVWFNEGGEFWTFEAGALWLIEKRV